jgi:hypothetical protein
MPHAEKSNGTLVAGVMKRDTPMVIQTPMVNGEKPQSKLLSVRLTPQPRHTSSPFHKHQDGCAKATSNIAQSPQYPHIPDFAVRRFLAFGL